MSGKFLISFIIAIVIPSAIVLYFAGIATFLVVLKLLVLLILGLSVLIYLIYSLGRDSFGKLSLNFDQGLLICSSLLRYMTILNLSIVILSAAVTILTFYGYIPIRDDGSYFLEVGIVLYDILFFLIGMIAYIASFKILKFSRLWYFLAIVVSIAHVPVLLGIFPVLFLVANRIYYFEVANVKTVDSYKKLQDLQL